MGSTNWARDMLYVRLSTMMHSSSRKKMASNGVTILIVEDHADTSHLFARAFRNAGFHVVTAESVARALNFLRMSKPVDAVLVDYVLGDGTGTAMLHQAENEGLLDLKATPAIVFSGYSYVEPPPNVVVLQKPIPPAQLVSELLKMLSDKVDVA